MASAIPSSLGRYEVLEELGKGAMGVVYLAKDPLIGRLVALKTFRASQAMHGSELVEYRARFMREAQSAGILSHPHIVTIHDVVDGADGSGLTFIAMEYVRGSNLKELMMRGEAMPLERIVDVVSQVAEALDYAHSKGVIHRDIKPANIIIDPQDDVKITDFGIARLETSDLTHEGQLLGTPNYMAPERILGHKVDHRTDIFSLGVVLYEMLTRQKPFQGENLTMVSHRIVYEPFAPPRQYAPGLPPGVVAVLNLALEKQPEQRYSSAGALASELRAAVADAAGSETTITPRPVLFPAPRLATPPPPPRVPTPPADPPSSRDDGSATQNVAGIGAAARAPSGSLAVPALSRVADALPSARRLMLLGVAAAALALLASLGAFGWVQSHTAPVGSPDAADRARAQYRPLLQEARRQLGVGHPELALLALARAFTLAPADPHLARMNERVRKALAARETVAQQQSQLSGLQQAAAAAMLAGDRTKAGDLARQVLALSPADAQATVLLAQIDAAAASNARRHTQQVTARAAVASTRARPAPAPATTTAPVADPQPAGPAMVRIDFFTEQPEGVLTIYADDRQILGEPFRFYKRTSLFHNEPKAGRIEAARQVPAGIVNLRVYVALSHQSTMVKTARVQVPVGGTKLVKILFDKAGNLTINAE